MLVAIRASTHAGAARFDPRGSHRYADRGADGRCDQRRDARAIWHRFAPGSGASDADATFSLSPSTFRALVAGA